jgi:hypothetical protein
MLKILLIIVTWLNEPIERKSVEIHKDKKENIYPCVIYGRQLTLKGTFHHIISYLKQTLTFSARFSRKSVIILNSFQK